jgi:hypothetical protein
VVHLEAEKIASEAMIALFERLAARNPTISVVLDNASYNSSAAIKSYLARDGAHHVTGALPDALPKRPDG